jgi:hypothetical protein
MYSFDVRAHYQLQIVVILDAKRIKDITVENLITKVQNTAREIASAIFGDVRTPAYAIA